MRYQISKINDASEETACDYCGQPLLTGDATVEVNNETYCSKGCLVRADEDGQTPLDIAERQHREDQSAGLEDRGVELGSYSS